MKRSKRLTIPRAAARMLPAPTHLRRLFVALVALLTMTAQTAWAEDVTLTEDTDETEGTAARWYVNMPKTGTNTLTLSDAAVTSFKVYDDGGKGNNYSDNCDGYLVITAPAGHVLQLSGSIDTGTADKLTVYDGSSGTNKLLSYVSGKKAITTVASTGQSIRLYFYSDASYNHDGLDLTVTVIDATAEHTINGLGTTTGGSVAATVGSTSVSAAKFGDLVTLTATPESDYLLSGLSVTDASGNAVAVAWDGSFSNTATFATPSSAVTVAPTFTNTWTVDGGLHINMPATGTKTVAIPSGVQSFKVYDDGGKDAPYSNNCNGTLTLTAPEGCKLQLSGSINTEYYSGDKLTVYNGSTSGTKLIDGVYGNYDAETAKTITTVTSTSNVMSIHFSSDEAVIRSGLDLTVTVVENDINISEVTGGSVAASIGGRSVTTAKAGDVVCLTVTPSEGYVFSGISVKDASGNAVAVTGGWYTNNQATFTMPASAVTVTPTFTSDLTSLSVNMPTTGKQSVTIPTGVQSFKVYDDGGASGNYSNSCKGTLVLTAPEGYVLQLSGSVVTEGKYDKLTVYDGSDANGTKLLNEVNGSTAITTVTSSGQSMTLYFYSDDRDSYAGLDLRVTLISTNTEYDITVNAATGGRIAASLGSTSASKAKINDVVTLTVTPETGYLLSDLSVVDANNSTVSVDWNLWANTATFTMPSTAVTVKPTFTNNLTNLFINMPTTGTKTATIPATVQSFKVYDDGKATNVSGYYSDGCNGYLIINAPSGYGLQVQGTVNLGNDPGTLNDYLIVYDGAYDGTGTAPAYLGEKEKYGQRITNDGDNIGTLVSTGSVMTLYFKSDDDSYTNYEGLDLTVTLVPLTPRGITIADNITGGSMTADPTSATYSSTVSLSATCNDGYVLNDLVVTDGNSNKVDVDWAPFANSATFSMPATAVNVTPTFSSAKTATDGLYVRMPLSGHKTANIPSGVTSFKLYDDGGTNNYTAGCDGTLTLTAPEGYRLEVEGSVTKSESTNESFEIYNSDQVGTSKINYGLNNNNLNSTYSSTGRYLTFRFKGAFDGYAGLDLTVTLVANPEHTVTVSNPTTGGTMTATPNKGTYNTNITLEATPAPGYKLSGVDVVDAGNNTVFATEKNDNTYDFFMPASDVTVTPRFTPIDYNITLAEGIPQGAVSFSKSKANLADVVTMTINGGYSYSGLTVTCNGNDVTLTQVSDTEYTFAMPEGDVVVSATFTANSYTVVFDKNADDATGDAMASQQFTYGTAQNLTASTFARTGYTFEGWATEATGEKVYTDGQDGSVISAAQGATVTLYAVWKGVGYTVSFNKNAGSLSISGSMADQAFTYGTEQALTQNAFTCPPGYSFAGWATSADGEKVYNDKQPVNNLTTTVGATITLYAKWAYSGWTSELQTDTEEAEGTAGRYYVNMPVNGSQTFTIPAENGVPTMNGKVLKSFKLYDNGGKGGSSNWSSEVPNGNYTPGYPSQLTITAPEGYRLRVDGDVNLVYKINNVSHRFELTHVEGQGTVSTLVSISEGVLSGQGSISLGHQSTGNSMMFSIVSEEVNNQNYSHSGVDVTVTIYKVDEEYNVNQADNLHGTVTKSADKGKYRDEITLTCGTPDDCYEAVTPITYTYLGNDGIMLTGTTAANGKFSMPNSDVTITQAFQPKSSGGMTITSANGEVTASFNDAATEGLNIPSTIEVDHVTIGRTYESGKASTVYLPFSIAAVNVTGGKFYTFTGVDETQTPWVVTYTEVTGNIEANTPYIFMPNGTNGGKMVVNNTGKISVCTASPQTTHDAGNKWEFIGTYVPIQWLSDNSRADEIGLVYGFAAKDLTVGTTNYEVGQFVKIGSGAFIKPMRAYLKRSATAGARTLSRGAAESLPETMVVVLRGSNGETTSVIELKNGKMEELDSFDSWYSLDGRKLSGKPTKKGLYINNGKKVVIK